MKSNADISEQQEALSAAHSVSAWLKSLSQNEKQFATVFGWAKDPVATTDRAPVFVYFLPTDETAAPNAPAMAVVCSSTNETLIAKASGRQGRLFGVYFTLSPNQPIETPGGTVEQPEPSALSAFTQAAEYMEGNTSGNPPVGNASLMLQAQLYVLPTPQTVPGRTKASPVLKYDVAVPCY
jgi:hypothetical protein